MPTPAPNFFHRFNRLPIYAAGVVAGIFALGVVAMLARSRAAYFSDPLTGPSSPKLSIPAGKYGYTPQGLRRNQSESGIDRAVVRTVSGTYLTTLHFTGEVSVNVAAGDTAFFGVGQATNDPNFIGEPSNCFLFRILNLADTQIDIAAAQAGRETHFLDIRKVAAYIPGTTNRFRIERDGDYVTLSIPSHNVRQTYSISQYNAQLGLTPDNTYLFFGNTGAGTVFSNFSIGPTAADDD
jgi:hypothetical protein